MTQSATDKLIVALDFAAYDDARHMVDDLGDAVSFCKVGLELLFHDRLAPLYEVRSAAGRLFPLSLASEGSA